MNRIKAFAASAVARVKRSALSAKNFALGAVGAASAAGMAAMSSPAMASPTLGAEALSKITGLESQVQAILMILVGVVFLFVLFAYIKRAK